MCGELVVHETLSPESIEGCLLSFLDATRDGLIFTNRTEIELRLGKERADARFFCEIKEN